MRLHSDTITTTQIISALQEVKDNKTSQVARDVYFEDFSAKGSRARKVAYEIKLGAVTKESGPNGKRRWNMNNTALAASYDEWGWFIAVLFRRDPHAVFGPYKGRADFNEKTHYDYSAASFSNQF